MFFKFSTNFSWKSLDCLFIIFVIKMGDSLPTTRYEENARSQLLEFIRMQQLNVAEKKRPREEVKPEATITKKAQKTSTSEKRRVEKACAHCQRSHLSCDNGSCGFAKCRHQYRSVLSSNITRTF